MAHSSGGGRHGLDSPTANRHELDGGGGHPLLAVALVALLLAGGAVAWFQARDKVGDQADSAAGKCVEGPTRVPIIASADIAEVLGDIAKRYNETKPVVRDHCVTVQVRPGDSKVTLDGLRGQWDIASMGERPAAWIPQSSIWAAALTSAKPEAVEGSPDSLASSPVVLAMYSEFAEKAAGKLDWGQLAPLSKRPDAMAQFGLPTWGPLRLAMPLGAGSDATLLATQAIASQAAQSPGALTATEVESPAATAAVRAVLDNAPPAPDGSATATVTAIAKSEARRGIHTVPITEQQLYVLARSGAIGDSLRSFSPSGPTPVADYPVLRLSSSQVTAEQSDGVAAFLEFAKQPDQIALLARSGYRAGDAPTPPANATVSFPAVRSEMRDPEPAASAALLRLVYR